MKDPLKQFATLLCALGLAHVSAAAPTPILVPGFLKFEVYTNLTGTAVSDLVLADSYPNSPARTFYMPSFDTRTVYTDDSHDNFGGRLTGFLTPSESGDYELFLRSDEASQLWFSLNDDPAQLELVAEETTCCGPFEETGAQETAFPASLVAGQRYAIQVLYKEGTGADYCQVAWRKVGDPTPAAQLQPIPVAFLSTMIPPQGSITITQQPASVSTVENETVTLSVGFTTTHGPIVVQWQKNGANVAGLTGSTITLGPLTAADAGNYRAVISIPGAVTNSAQATLTVAADTRPPTIRSVTSSSTFDLLTVVFSEAVQPEGASDNLSYSLDGGLSLVGAPVVVNPTTVRLMTTPQTRGATYTLTISDIVDLANNTSTAGTSRTFTTLNRTPGGLNFEVWFGIGGNAVSALTGDPRYPASPDLSAYIREFTSRQVFPDANSMNNYGGRMSGWIVPPETAQYEFFIRSDDDSELRLSTDEEPVNATLIANGVCCGPFMEPGDPATSMPISLTTGNAYYIEALWKEGGGGDYCDVAWRKVGTPGLARDLTFIPGSVLQGLGVPGTFVPPTVSFASPANGTTFGATETVTLIANATAASSKSISRVEFLSQGRVVAVASNSPYSVTFYELREDNHTFIARAVDSAGLATETASLTISVGAQLSTVRLLAIDTVTMWKYDRTGRDLGTEWSLPGYDDSAWPSGLTLIADEGTVTVEPIRTRISRFNDMGMYVQTFYFRTHFNFDGPITPVVKLRLRHVVDDGVLFYLNGAEVHRFGFAQGVIVNYLTSADGHENAYEGPYDLPLDNLVVGDNVFAAELHQAGGSSSDMVFGAELIATVPVIRPTLTITRDGPSVRIAWSPAGGTLESSPTLTGAMWTPVAGATNPYTTAAGGSARFYRVAR
jgi:hypothetical protein